MSARATRATEALRHRGVAHQRREYATASRSGHGRAERPNYGQEAAAALGVAPERVFKTLVARLDGQRLVVGVVPVSRELDPRRLAEAAGGRRAELADPGDAERATGYVVGGISPLGQRRPLPIFVDASAFEHETVFVSGGRRGLQLELAPRDLVDVVGAVVAPIAR